MIEVDGQGGGEFSFLKLCDIYYAECVGRTSDVGVASFIVIRFLILASC